MVLIYLEETMTSAEKSYAAWCAENDPHSFYIWRRWVNVRESVLSMDKHECQRCRNMYHRYREADTVHHVNHFKDRPDLALDVWYTDPVTHKQRRNLVSLCRDCHAEVHERTVVHRSQLTQERWD